MIDCDLMRLATVGWEFVESGQLLTNRALLSELIACALRVDHT